MINGGEKNTPSILIGACIADTGNGIISCLDYDTLLATRVDSKAIARRIALSTITTPTVSSIA
eukprot:scaffold108098_cov15-Prasinocladus_malaysianus.AAC.1